MNELIKERIKDNKKLFTKKELKIIYNNFTLIIKIYMLGFLDKF